MINIKRLSLNLMAIKHYHDRKERTRLNLCDLLFRTVSTIVRREVFKKFRINFPPRYDRGKPLLAVELQLTQIVGVSGVEEQVRVILKRHFAFLKRFWKVYQGFRLTNLIWWFYSGLEFSNIAPVPLKILFASKRGQKLPKNDHQFFFQKFILNVNILRTDIFNYVILTVKQENSYCWGIWNFFMLKHFLHPLSNETKTWNEPGHLRRSSRSAFWA